jgi:hypothetical protein
VNCGGPVTGRFVAISSCAAKVGNGPEAALSRRRRHSSPSALIWASATVSWLSVNPRNTVIASASSVNRFALRSRSTLPPPRSVCRATVGSCLFQHWRSPQQFAQSSRQDQPVTFSDSGDRPHGAKLLLMLGDYKVSEITTAYPPLERGYVAQR